MFVRNSFTMELLDFAVRKTAAVDLPRKKEYFKKELNPLVKSLSDYLKVFDQALKSSQIPKTERSNWDWIYRVKKPDCWYDSDFTNFLGIVHCPNNF